MFENHLLIRSTELTPSEVITTNIMRVSTAASSELEAIHEDDELCGDV